MSSPEKERMDKLTQEFLNFVFCNSIEKSGDSHQFFAKKRKEKQMKILSFSDVDTALKRVCELEVALNQLNGEITLKCNEIKDAAKSQIEKLDSEKKYLEQQITVFCEENKGEFAEKRSKEFTFGKIGYKISKTVRLPRLKDKVEKLISALKSYKLNDCIKYEETLDKDAIAELSDAELVKLGLNRVVKDNFRIETKTLSLESANI